MSIHPPFTDIRSVQTVLEGDKLQFILGAQNCHWEDKGAFTGEVSPAMLAKLNVRYVIAGHSERRELFGETDEMVNRKVRAVLKARHDADPVLRRDLEEREAGGTEARSAGQVQAGLAGRHRRAGRRAGDRLRADLGDRHRADRDGGGRPGGVRVDPCRGGRRCAGADGGRSVRIQYGGSVKADNAAGLMAQPDIDGALVGGASLEAESFALIVKPEA